jgi:2-aminoethylphosphonate-pyruvate transaminase
MKRVMVDMSVSLFHHGHIRLLQRAKALDDAYVIVALTTDDEIIKCKGFAPELDYEARKEILLALSCVDEVVPSPWLITEEFVRSHNADCLVHSGPNANPVANIVEFDRTEGVASSDMRVEAIYARMQKMNSERILLTPGPTNLHPESLQDIEPFFTRGDQKYTDVSNLVLKRIASIAGKEKVAAMQGSATTAIEVATSNWLHGSVLIIESGYYSRRMKEMIDIKQNFLSLKKVAGMTYDDFVSRAESQGAVDWVVFAYTETADAFLADIEEVKRISTKLGARLMVDATGSINLENHHELADVSMFSSCKGLGGFTGAGFIAFDERTLSYRNNVKQPFILDLDTYLERKTTAPVQALSSLLTVSERFSEYGNRVREAKAKFLAMFEPFLLRKTNQPALCTKVRGLEIAARDSIIAYEPRTCEPDCRVICHLFEQFPSNRQIGELYETLFTRVPAAD